MNYNARERALLVGEAESASLCSVFVRCDRCLKRFGAPTLLGELLVVVRADGTFGAADWAPLIRSHNPRYGELRRSEWVPNGRLEEIASKEKRSSDFGKPQAGGIAVPCRRCGRELRTRVGKLLQSDAFTTRLAGQEVALLV